MSYVKRQVKLHNLMRSKQEIDQYCVTCIVCIVLVVVWGEQALHHTESCLIEPLVYVSASQTLYEKYHLKKNTWLFEKHYNDQQKTKIK